MIDELVDNRHFRKGPTLILDGDRFRRLTIWDRIKMLRQRVLWWRVRKYMTVAIGIEKGSVTVVELKWSWRRFKWVAP